MCDSGIKSSLVILDHVFFSNKVRLLAYSWRPESKLLKRDESTRLYWFGTIYSSLVCFLVVYVVKFQLLESNDQLLPGTWSHL